tara:strand:- start:244602 stop:246050 length:1449 start_codon:yes stop_codon:yes gene_type:complete
LIPCFSEEGSNSIYSHNVDEAGYVEDFYPIGIEGYPQIIPDRPYVLQGEGDEAVLGVRLMDGTVHFGGVSEIRDFLQGLDIPSSGFEFFRVSVASFLADGDRRKAAVKDAAAKFGNVELGSAWEGVELRTRWDLKEGAILPRSTLRQDAADWVGSVDGKPLINDEYDEGEFNWLSENPWDKTWVRRWTKAWGHVGEDSRFVLREIALSWLNLRMEDAEEVYARDTSPIFLRLLSDPYWDEDVLQAVMAYLEFQYFIIGWARIWRRLIDKEDVYYELKERLFKLGSSFLMEIAATKFTHKRFKEWFSVYNHMKKNSTESLELISISANRSFDYYKNYPRFQNIVFFDLIDIDGVDSFSFQKIKLWMHEYPVNNAWIKLYCDDRVYEKIDSELHDRAEIFLKEGEVQYSGWRKLWLRVGRRIGSLEWTYNVGRSWLLRAPSSMKIWKQVLEELSDTERGKSDPALIDLRNYLFHEEASKYSSSS